MEEQILYTVPEMLRNSFHQYGGCQSLVFAGEEGRTYAQLESEIHLTMEKLFRMGIRKGDKVAILSLNMPNWCIVYFAVASLGAVVVPILPDFSPSEISNILEHSESKIVFVSESLVQKIRGLIDQGPIVVIAIESFELLSGVPVPISDEVELAVPEIHEDDLLSIIYTSGTTGKSKGVMLSHKNILWDAAQGSKIHKVLPSDRFLSLLPLSHTYENTIGMITPIMYGASVHYLKKLPTPSVLLPILQVVRPTTILAVPLIIEKIFRKQIEPRFTANAVIRTLYRISPVRVLLHRIAGRKLKELFGGCVRFFGIGGAKLDGTVERFLKEARFPYSIGYGLTETAPLIAGAAPAFSKLTTIGPAMPGTVLKINNPDPKTGQGEIWVKGENIMKGYYKEPEMTREVITEEGWFKTGDLGAIDQKGYLSFKGRLKNLIVSASGENIYPEEIESVINNFRHVVESLVIERKGKLVALVLLNMEELESKYQAFKGQAEEFNAKLDELVAELQQYVNSHVSKFAQVQMVIVQPEPFERTPTQKIKRFLYS